MTMVSFPRFDKGKKGKEGKKEQDNCGCFVLPTEKSSSSHNDRRPLELDRPARAKGKGGRTAELVRRLLALRKEPATRACQSYAAGEGGGWPT